MALKGHAKIELKDVNTGEVTVQESDNMFTNALNVLLNKVMPQFNGSNMNINNFLPLVEKGLRGIMLFEDTIDEDPNNYYLPSNNRVTGYAGDNTDVDTNEYRGYYNSDDSEELDNGYKFVWEFPTNKGNGIISALALTNRRIEQGVGTIDCANYSTYNRLDSNDNIMTVTDNDEIVYTTRSGTSLRIRKYNMGTDKITLKNKSSLSNSFDKTITVPRECKWYDAGDGYAYGITTSGNTLYVSRINLDTYELDEDYGEKTVTLSESITFSNGAAGGGYLFVFGDTQCIKLDLASLTELQKCNALISSTVKTPASNFYLNGWIYSCNAVENYTNYYDNMCSWQSDLENYQLFKGTRSSAMSAIFIKDLIVYCIYSASYLKKGTYDSYLATINNLTTPITKTSAQTMKITYTVTEE